MVLSRGPLAEISWQNDDATRAAQMRSITTRYSKDARRLPEKRLLKQTLTLESSKLIVCRSYASLRTFEGCGRERALIGGEDV